MSPLEDQLRTQIALSGPITIADYMSQCLFHPEHGYYSTGQPFGRSGDFITAPEISQMFGELVGLCLAQTWMDQGAPARVALVELGPGRGTLMADILRTADSIPKFSEALEVHMLEASPTLTALQKEALAPKRAKWHTEMSTLPKDLPLLVVANEFFDALPIRQFQRSGTGWCERHIGLNGNDLSMGLTAPSPLAELKHRLDDTQDGDLVELCPAAPAIASALGQRIARNGGAAVIFDYGDWRSLGDTLQAVRGHERVDILSQPGNSDLTAHVDFEALVRDLPCAHTRLSTQGTVLERLGITARAQALAKGLSGATLDMHIAAHRRLTHPDEMGTVFKSLALYPQEASPPAGYQS